jgi:hypothetical protein
MSLYVRLNKNIDPNKLLKDINKEIKKEAKDEGDILVIEVRKTTEVIEKITREQVTKHLSEK